MDKIRTDKRFLRIGRDVLILLFLLGAYGVSGYAMLFLAPLEELYRWLGFFLLTAFFSNVLAGYLAEVPARYRLSV